MIIRRHNSGNVAFDTHTQISNLPPIYSAQISRPRAAEWNGVVQWGVLEVKQPCNDQKICLAGFMQQPNLPVNTLLHI
jgi:hypothetical protein